MKKSSKVESVDIMVIIDSKIKNLERDLDDYLRDMIEAKICWKLNDVCRR